MSDEQRLTRTATRPQKWTMDPWDAHFHATVPLLNDPRVQSLNLAPALQFLKATVTREHLTPPFADSRRDFQLSQGWSGWYYSFERVGPIEEFLLSPERHGIVEESTFVMDREHPRRPFMDDVSQHGFVSPEGDAVAAVRTFRSPKAMYVAVEASYRSFHTCGDGTRLSLVLVRGRGQAPEVLHEWQTMDDGFAEFAGEAFLRAGSTVSLVSDPLGDDECDRVEVSLRLTPISPEKMGWSGLARAAMWKRAEEQKAAEHAALAKGSNNSVPVVTDGEVQWTPAEPPKQSTTDDQVFNVALIFDRHRLEHVKSVIRSVRHFTTSRDVVFHLVSPPDLHHQLEKEFNVAGSTIRTYDHALCGFVVRKVLPFSNPDIHTSAHCKMFLTDIITIAERVLYLDTDVTVTSDLSACYGQPVNRPGALVSMGVDMGDVCQRNPDLCWPIGLHWRVPPGLVCGNVPSRALSREPPSCAHEGELETLQVNGGVALFELAKMREVGFVDRYVQSVVHHFRMMGSSPARWGEQDFVNSYFRLHPDELELLPCGCNYQWFGARREVMCGNQPVTIAHHWSVSLALSFLSLCARQLTSCPVRQGPRHRREEQGAVQRPLPPLYRWASRGRARPGSPGAVVLGAGRAQLVLGRDRTHAQLPAPGARLHDAAGPDRVRPERHCPLPHRHRDIRSRPGRLARGPDVPLPVAGHRIARRRDRGSAAVVPARRGRPRQRARRRVCRPVRQVRVARRRGRVMLDPARRPRRAPRVL